MAFYKCDKKQNGGTGFKVDDVSNFTAVADSSDAKVTLSWTDPDDFEIEGIVQAKWAGTIIVRKAYSEPKSTADGTIVLNSTVKNQYSVNGFVDENVNLSTTYYYRAFPYTTDGNTTVGSSMVVETATEKIYGVEWDGTAAHAWTRTDDAAEFENPNPCYEGMKKTPSSPFDNIMPWSGLQVIEDADAGTLVSIPKFYYKWTRNEAKMKLQISMAEFDGSYVSPAHADRGDGKGERDVVYVGAYHCAADTYKSTTGVLPQNNITISTARSNIHNLGLTIWQSDFAMFWTIRMLYLVEYADWDCQNRIGLGVRGAYNQVTNTGACDSMAYHTGTTADTRGGYSHVRYRYIEDLWSNLHEWVDGIYSTETNDIYCIKNPAQFSSSSGGVKIGEKFDNSTSAVISSWSMPSVSGFEYALLPATIVSGSGGVSGEYTSDGYYTNVDTPTMLCAGSSYLGGWLNGLFFFGMERPDDDLGGAVSIVGCRLMKLP